MGEFKEDIKSTGNEAIGKVKETTGDATDNASLENEGKMQQQKGQLQEEKADVEGALGNDI